MRRASGSGGALAAWGRLARLSLAPSAAADVAAGLWIGGYGDLPRAPDTALLILASLAIYHGGMILNDWADRGPDARTRPGRPLPSGAIAPRSALAAALALEALGVALASIAAWRAGAWMAGLALLAVAYDLAGRGAWIGPALLGACRAANLGVGLAFSGALAAAPVGVVPPGAAWLAAAYGAYVFCASRVARLEDLPDEASIGSAPRTWLGFAAVILVAPAFVDPYDRPDLLPDPFALAIGLAAAFALARAAWRTREWTRADVGRATGAALRRTMAFTAACAAAADTGDGRGIVLAAAILACLPASAALRRVFPPT
jgi:4-hydroxybenzoate polyprenyltransferase